MYQQRIDEAAFGVESPREQSADHRLWEARVIEIHEREPSPNAPKKQLPSYLHHWKWVELSTV